MKYKGIFQNVLDYKPDGQNLLDFQPDGQNLLDFQPDRNIKTCYNIISAVKNLKMC